MDPVNIHYGLEMLSSESLAQSGGDPSVGAVEHFQQQMQGPGATTDVQAGETISVLPVGGSSPTMGDKILQGLQNMKSGYDEQIGAVQTSVSRSDPLNIRDMMQLQLDLAKLTLQGELINKTVSKSTQNLDTLLKSQ